MNEYIKGAYREFTLDSIFSEDVQVPDNKIIWKSRNLLPDGRPDPENEELIQIAQNGINVVSSRDVRRNVRTSLRIGLDLAASGLRVLYVNSYAGIGLLRESLQSELDKSEQRPETKNFHILDCKMGMWSECAGMVRQMLYSSKWDTPKQEYHYDSKIDVLILNSFEFSGMYYYDKRSIGMCINDWVSNVPLTTIVFTQETHPLMSAGIPLRGPIGLLTLTALTVSRLEEPKTIAPKAKGTLPVHELQTKTDNKIIYTNQLPEETTCPWDEEDDEPKSYDGPYDEEGRQIRYAWEGTLSPENPNPPEWPINQPAARPPERTMWRP